MVQSRYPPVVAATIGERMSDIYNEGYADGVVDTVNFIRENESIDINWRDVLNAINIKTILENVKVECPEHGGNFDCTPFCKTCEGNQEY
jgi:hypothetical protein